ncbi:MAG: VWA domain-containing protein [Alphaproteobacteria bacterium]|nr:VWA domain-containing protein [Alphaproteobacteria bacterium]
MRPPAIAVLAIGLLSGCIDYEYAERTVTDVFTQIVDERRTDVLLVIDNSASMGEEQALLAENFAAFTDVLMGATSDFRVGVITTDPGDGGALRDDWLDADTPELDLAFQEAVQVGTRGSRDEQGLAMALYALDSDINPGFLRGEAALHVVFFADEDDHSSGDPEYYLNEYRRLSGTGGFATHAIVGDLPDGCVSGTVAADPGERYLAAAYLSAGHRDSICARDYEDVLGRVGLSVTGLLDRFPLSQLPEPETLVVWVDGVVIPEREVDGWTLSLGDNAVVFHGRSVPRPGMTVTVEYEPLVGTVPGDDTGA